MRALAWIGLASGMILASAPAQGQTYDPGYPVCLQVYDSDGGYIECAYTSLGQCNAAASGRGAQCLINPFFPHASSPPAYPEQRNRHLAR